MFYKTKKAHAVLGISIPRDSLTQTETVRNCKCDLSEKVLRDKANKFCSFCGNPVWKLLKKPIPEWHVMGRKLYAKSGNTRYFDLVYSDEQVEILSDGQVKFPDFFFIVACVTQTSTSPGSRNDADEYVGSTSNLPKDLEKAHQGLLQVLEAHGIRGGSFGLYAVLEHNVQASDPRC
jgi:hypothetical protein